MDKKTDWFTDSYQRSDQTAEHIRLQFGIVIMTTSVSI